MACKHLLDYANDVHLFIYHSTYVILIRNLNIVNKKSINICYDIYYHYPSKHI